MADVIGDIRRPLNQDELKHIVPVFSKKNMSELNKFRAVLADTMLQIRRKLIPYCEACALADYNQRRTILAMDKGMDKEDNRVCKEVSKEFYTFDKAGNIDASKLVEKYTGEQLFEKLDETEAREKTLIDNHSVMKLIGYHFNYQCKKRMHKFSMFVPIDKYREMKNKKKV